LVEIRQIVAPNFEAENHDANNRESSRRIGERRPVEQSPQRGSVGAPERFEWPVAKRTAGLAQRQVGKSRNKRQADNERAKRREAHGKGQGCEQGRLAAL